MALRQQWGRAPSVPDEDLALLEVLNREQRPRLTRLTGCCDDEKARLVGRVAVASLDHKTLVDGLERLVREAGITGGTPTAFFGDEALRPRLARGDRRKQSR